MSKIIFIALLLLGILFSENASAQKPAERENFVALRKSFYGGASLLTNGWGLNAYYAKQKTAKIKRLYSFDFSFVRHPKEYKTYNPYDRSSKSYMYGKLNAFSTLQVGIGAKKILHEKLRIKGVEIGSFFTCGPSLGFVKPVYLEILNFDGVEVIGVNDEKYNPEEHGLYNIYGRAASTKGLGELKFTPGAFIKGGFNFEFHKDRDVVRSIEVGAKIDCYLKRVPIMAGIYNKFIFAELYIGFHFGKKFI